MSVVRLSSPSVSVSRVVSSPLNDFAYYNSPFEYRGYGYPYGTTRYPYAYGYGYRSPYYTYPYAYSAPIYSTPIYSAPVSTAVVVSPTSATVVAAAPASTAYGTCKAVTGVGVTSNNCASGKVAVSTASNGCMCADQVTGLAGCGNVLNGVCK